jgi:hypothetical protein
MKGKASVVRVAMGVAVVAVLMGVVAAPAMAAVTPPTTPKLDIAHPLAGDHMRRGTIWVTGVACDPSASTTDTTAGISRIQVFAGDRDQGISQLMTRPGGYLGAATSAGVALDISNNTNLTSRLAATNPDVSTGCRNPNAGFRILTSALRRGTYDLNVYVLSKAGAETKTTVPGIVVDSGKF